MTETQNQTSNTFIAEVHEAIRNLTAYSIKYSNIIQTLKETQKTADAETAPVITGAIQELRYYEKHAYIRLRAISESEKIDLTQIEKYRESLNEMIPKEVEITLLTIEYNKILANKFNENILKNTQETVSELSGNL